MIAKSKKNSAPVPKIAATAPRTTPRTTVRPSVKGMVENIIGCKWSLTVLSLVQQGVCRPGAMEHAIEGLSAKVLNERLRKLVRYGILTKTTFAEVPPRVEYRLTPFGRRFGKLIEQIEVLENEARH